MTWQELIGWWNLIFLLPFMLALLYLAVYLVSGLEFGTPDADIDHDIDADVDADADVDSDAELDADADADSDHHADSHATGSHSHFGGLLSSLLGLGTLPISLLLMILLMIWGVTGVSLNASLKHRFSEPGNLILVTAPLTLVIALAITRMIAEVVGRYLPFNETYAKHRHELLGLVGEAMYDINSTFGMASVKDADGNLYQVGCRIADDSPLISKGERVKFVGYSAAQKLFYVVADPSKQ